MSQTPDRLLGTLAREAGYQHRGQVLSGSRRAPAGRWRRDIPNWLTRPTPARRASFFSTRGIESQAFRTRVGSWEAPLSNFLQKNFRALAFFKKAGLRYLGAEVAIVPGCKIDILTEHKKTNELVGIELKASEPDKGLVSQAGRYMTALKQKAARDGRPGARLLIVSGQPDQEFQSQVQALMAESRGVPTRWLTWWTCSQRGALVLP